MFIAQDKCCSQRKLCLTMDGRKSLTAALGVERESYLSAQRRTRHVYPPPSRLRENCRRKSWKTVRACRFRGGRWSPYFSGVTVIGARIYIICSGLYSHCHKHITGAREMSPMLRALAILPEDAGWFANTHIVFHKHLQLQSSFRAYPFLSSMDTAPKQCTDIHVSKNNQTH